MDTTTIQVKKPTKELLDSLKESYDSKTYDEVILELVKRKTKSMWGKLANGKKFSVKDIMEDLRDKRNRF